jgi:predicted ribosomally synthesized peptide with SipW-like signal peptide
MKKILISLSIVGAVAAIIIGATGALLTDTGTSNNNTFAAGKFDLKIDSTCHYDGMICGLASGVWEEEKPDSSRRPELLGKDCACSWGIDNFTGQPFFDFTDVKPGDDGEDTVSLHLDDNPGWLCAQITNLKNADNACTQPEAVVDTTCDNPGLGQGELQDNLFFNIWKDVDCQNDFDEGVDTYLLKDAKATDGMWPVFDSSIGPPLPGGVTTCIGIGWNVPLATNNIIQTDSFSADVIFNAVQARNNPDYVCVPGEPFCGDGIKNGTEQCDGTDGVGPHQSCSASCTLINEPYCGDGIKNGTEQCDGTDGVGPNQTCHDCILVNLPYCGDGIVNDDEECDDGNTIDTDACKNNCTLPSVCEFHLDVMMVMDRSGSMGYDIPTRLSQAKTAANTFLGILGTGDQSGLVSYATTASLNKILSNNHVATQAQVSSLVALGSTNIGDAINLANGQLTNPSVEQIEILLTDGKANRPHGPGYGEDPADVTYALTKASAAAAAGIKIYTIGLGTDINATMLQTIASTTGGQYYFAPTAGDLDAIFQLLKLNACGG